MSRLWDAGEPLDALVLRYTAGEDAALDEELVAYDLRASAAHADMLHACGYLGDEAHDALVRELAVLGVTHARGEWRIGDDEEDCHTAIENRLVARLGEIGGAIHLGRSRNDQVLAALRLWLLDRLAEMARAADAVARALDGLAQGQGALPMPGYTHMQRAMPSTVGLWAAGWAAEIRDDADGLVAARRRADRNPLGSAAGYGTPGLALDRDATTRALGFGQTQEPVTAAQVSRGKAEASALFEATLLAQDLGRLAADLCLFATAEFGFVRLPAAFTTGSSIMPQKRNPDVFEIARGRTAEAVAALIEVLSVTGKLTSGYHRDLQGIKKPLFRGLASVRDTAVVMAHALPGVAFDGPRMAAAIDDSMHAAERANRLAAAQGIPFREAYRRVNSGNS